MFLVFFFFKQKTAYEMRISDWSSDVCSSDLRGRLEAVEFFSGHRIDRLQIALEGAGPHREGLLLRPHDLTLGGIPGDEIAEVVAEIGRASCRERVCQYV